MDGGANRRNEAVRIFEFIQSTVDGALVLNIEFIIPRTKGVSLDTHATPDLFINNGIEWLSQHIYKEFLIRDISFIVAISPLLAKI